MCWNHFCNKRASFQAVQKLSRPSGKYPDCPKTFQAIQKISRLSRNFPGYPENFPDHPETTLTIRKLSRLSKNFPDYPKTILTSGTFSSYPETFQTIRKLSELLGKFPDGLESFRKLSWLPRNFSGYTETLKAIRKITRLSGNFSGYTETFQAIRTTRKYPDYLEIFQTVRKLPGAISRVTPKKLSGRAKTFRTRKNFPDGNATLPPRFLGLCCPQTSSSWTSIYYWVNLLCLSLPVSQSWLLDQQQLTCRVLGSVVQTSTKLTPGIRPPTPRFSPNLSKTGSLRDIWWGRVIWRSWLFLCFW